MKYVAALIFFCCAVSANKIKVIQFSQTSQAETVEGSVPVVRSDVLAACVRFMLFYRYHKVITLFIIFILNR